MTLLQSLRHGFALTAQRQIAHPRDLIGRAVKMRDGRTFVTFRQTVVVNDAGTGHPAVLIVRFRFRIPDRDTSGSTTSSDPYASSPLPSS